MPIGGQVFRNMRFALRQFLIVYFEEVLVSAKPDKSVNFVSEFMVKNRFQCGGAWWVPFGFHVTFKRLVDFLAFHDVLKQMPDSPQSLKAP